MISFDRPGFGKTERVMPPNGLPWRFCPQTLGENPYSASFASKVLFGILDRSVRYSCTPYAFLCPTFVRGQRCAVYLWLYFFIGGGRCLAYCTGSITGHISSSPHDDNYIYELRIVHQATAFMIILLFSRLPLPMLLSVVIHRLGVDKVILVAHSLGAQVKLRFPAGQNASGIVQ